MDKKISLIFILKVKIFAQIFCKKAALTLLKEEGK
jgi:hypothetical protein